MEDCKRKNRMNKGEARPQAKLTDEAVRELRARREKGETVNALAREFGIGKSTAWHVVKRENWAHVV